MVIHDATTFPGHRADLPNHRHSPDRAEELKARLNETTGLFAVPRRSHSELGLNDVRELSKPIQQELEKFFIATDELEDKSLKIIGWKGPKTALKAIKQSAALVARTDE